jgi:hypothetical protein
MTGHGPISVMVVEPAAVGHGPLALTIQPDSEDTAVICEPGGSAGIRGAEVRITAGGGDTAAGDSRGRIARRGGARRWRLTCRLARLDRGHV